MVKLSSTTTAVRRPPVDHQYRIGFTDLTMDSLWNSESEKYKVLCRMIHVTKATLHIGYIQMMISFIFLVFFTYHYMMAVTGHLSAEHWINQYTARYISQLLLAVSLQLVLVVVMIHGVRSERRSLLLPYIIYASVAILAGCAQLGSDFMNMEHHHSAGHGSHPTGHSEASRIYGNSQFVSHLVGTMIHAWCLSVVWRCYGFLGEKKVARQIGEQLASTQAAFSYPDQLIGYLPMAQPPPYADTVMSPSAAMPPPSFPVSQGVDAAPLLSHEQENKNDSNIV